MVGFGPGSVTDLMARLLAEEARKHLPNNQPIVIVNRPGAFQVIALTELLRAKPDGYRIMIAGIASLTVQPHLGITTFSYDSFEEIMCLSNMVFYLAVRADAPWKTFEEFAEYARKNPRTIAYGSAGTGSGPHLAVEYVSRKLGINMTHVPFTGSAEAQSAVIGGHVDAAILAGLPVDPTRVRVLVNFGSLKPSGLRDVPTFEELGYDIDIGGASGLVGPPGMRPEVVAVIHDAFKKALENPVVVERLDRMSVVAEYLSGEEWKRRISREYELNRQVMRNAGLI